jgi:tetrapyrrole methylase family protein / MazG family protein
VTRSSAKAAEALRALLDVVLKLRSPGGCDWDRSRSKEDISAYLLDEVYEVIDAVDSGPPEALKEELGDVLFQILFFATMAEEKGEFDMADVIADITAKMIRRHPHVFGDRKVRDVEEIRANWEDIKKNVENKQEDLHPFDRVPRSMPALLKAQKVTEKASRLGFDWPGAEGVFGKLEEEIGELRIAIGKGRQEEVAEEMGDLLFTLVNLCRFLKVDAEGSLRAALEKFILRFKYIEERLNEEGKTAEGASLAEMDRLWDESKRGGRNKP